MARSGRRWYPTLSSLVRLRSSPVLSRITAPTPGARSRQSQAIYSLQRYRALFGTGNS